MATLLDRYRTARLWLSAMASLPADLRETYNRVREVQRDLNVDFLKLWKPAPFVLVYVEGTRASYVGGRLAANASYGKVAPIAPIAPEPAELVEPALVTFGTAGYVKTPSQLFELEAHVLLRDVRILVFCDTARVRVTGIFNGVDLVTCALGDCPMARTSQLLPGVKVRVQCALRDEV